MLWFVALIFFAHAERWDETYNLKKHGFEEIAKFCGRTRSNLYNPAFYFKFEMDASGFTNATDESFVLAIYDDEDHSWPKQDKISSSQKCDTLADGQKKWGVGMFQAHNFRFDDRMDAEFVIDLHETQRPHFWYAAIVNCKKPDFKIKIKTHAWQSAMGKWSEEFSYNEKGLNSMYLVFLLFYPLTLLLQFHSYSLHQLSGMHRIVHLLTACLVLQTLGTFFIFVNYAHFADQGTAQQFCLILGQMLAITAQTMFMFILFCISQGWIISHPSVPEHIKTISIGTAVFWIIHIIILFAGVAEKRRDNLRYKHESWAQFSFVLIFACIGGIFAVLIYNTWRVERSPHKQSLYLKIGGIYFLWFESPLLSLWISYLLDPWTRDITSLALWETTTFIWFTLLVVILHPRVSVLEIPNEEKTQLATLDSAAMMVEPEAGMYGNLSPLR